MLSHNGLDSALLPPIFACYQWLWMLPYDAYQLSGLSRPAKIPAFKKPKMADGFVSVKAVPLEWYNVSSRAMSFDKGVRLCALRVSLTCNPLGAQLLLLLLLQPFYDPLSGTTQVSRYQKDKPLWMLLKQSRWGGSGISWTICKLFALRSKR